MSPKQPARLLSSTARDEDDSDATLRPKTLADFVGQAQARANLAVFIGAARARAAALDHVLFVGPPGLGKTTLAQIVARELGVNFRATSGPVIAKAGDLAALLTNLEDRDVLFIDEIHRLHPAVEEILYPAMEDFQLDLIIGEGPGARSVRIDLARFTLVGATTRLGLLTNPLRDRFGIPVRLSFYTNEELEQIVTRGARILGLKMTAKGAAEIANRSRGTPRIASRLLRRVSDFALMEGDGEIDAGIADRALRRLEVDQLGLDALDRRYLFLVAESFSGGPVGIETIAAALSEPRDAIEEIVEPFLIQQGFVQRTPRGRVLTLHAFRHIGLAAPSDRPEQIGLFRRRRRRMTLRALIFDVDGTLAETEEVHRQSFNETFAARGLPWHWTVETYNRLLDVTGGKERLRHFIESDRPPGGSEALPEIAALHAEKTARYTQLIDQGAATPRPGVARLIREARTDGLKVAIATTTSLPNVEALLRAMFGPEGMSLFDAIGAGDVVPRKKPAPDIFEWALRELALAPFEAVALENSRNGIRSARGAGLAVVTTPSLYSEGQDFSGSLAVISDFGEPERPYAHIAGCGKSDRLLTVPALRRWLAETSPSASHVG